MQIMISSGQNFYIQLLISNICSIMSVVIRHIVRFPCAVSDGSCNVDQ